LAVFETKSLSRYALIFLVLAGAGMFTAGKMLSPVRIQTAYEALREPTPTPLKIALAGPARGLVADVTLMEVYTLFAHVQKNRDHQKGWDLIYQYLQSSQQIDPWFWDAYRFSAGLLGMRKEYIERIIDLLEKGSEARKWDWETPFMAGFLAYDQLHDLPRAFSLMRKAADKPEAPPMAAGLASRFLQKMEGTQASIDFLLLMMRNTPPKYQEGLKKRVEELKAGITRQQKQNRSIPLKPAR